MSSLSGSCTRSDYHFYRRLKILELAAGLISLRQLSESIPDDLEFIDAFRELREDNNVSKEKSPILWVYYLVVHFRQLRYSALIELDFDLLRHPNVKLLLLNMRDALITARKEIRPVAAADLAIARGVSELRDIWEGKS